jgi:hypothetical protein
VALRQAAVRVHELHRCEPEPFLFESLNDAADEPPLNGVWLEKD